MGFASPGEAHSLSQCEQTSGQYRELQFLTIFAKFLLFLICQIIDKNIHDTIKFSHSYSYGFCIRVDRNTAPGIASNTIENDSKERNTSKTLSLEFSLHTD